MKLSIVVRQPWELGYDVKTIINDADFEFQLDAAGWVGDMRLVLPRTSLFELGDEVEIRDDKNRAIWAGKIVSRHLSSNSPSVSYSVRGLCEFAFELPVDLLFIRRRERTPWTDLWGVCCNLARQHWSRIYAELGTAPSVTIREPIDLRGRTLGDIWRMMRASADVFLLPRLRSLEGWDGRLELFLTSGRRKILLTTRQITEWSLDQDLQGFYNRLLASYRIQTEQNLAPDPSFEDIPAGAWVESPEQLPPFGLIKSSMTVAPWCSHHSLLYINLPPNSTYTLQTANPISFGNNPLAVQVNVWVHGSGQGERMRAVLGNDALSFTSLSSGWQHLSWAWPDVTGNHIVKFEINNPTSNTIRVYLDQITIQKRETPIVAIQPPLLWGTTEQNIMPYGAFWASDAIARVLRCRAVSGTEWQVFVPSSYAFTTADINKSVEIWQWGLSHLLSRIVKGKITQIVSEGVLNITITQNPANATPDQFVGGVFRILNNTTALGAKYTHETFANAEEAQANLATYSQPNTRLSLTLVEYPFLITPRHILVISEFSDIATEFPVVSNQVTVKSGKVVTQTVEAGSREFTLRAMMRKFNKAMREYVQTR